MYAKFICKQKQTKTKQKTSFKKQTTKTKLPAGMTILFASLIESMTSAAVAPSCGMSDASCDTGDAVFASSTW